MNNNNRSISDAMLIKKEKNEFLFRKEGVRSRANIFVMTDDANSTDMEEVAHG